MTDTWSVKSCFSPLSDYDESVAECCVCRRPMSDPAILQCLHSVCRSCLSVCSLGESSSFVECPACSEATPRTAILSNTFLSNYVCLSALASEEILNCQTCDAERVAAAVFWCKDCCMALCESCYTWHNRFNRRHISAELEIARTWSVSQLAPNAQCCTHKRHMEMQCFTCRLPKCLLCYESCRANRHELHPLSHGNTRKHIASVIEVINLIREQLCCRISGLQQKCLDTRRHLQLAREKDRQRVLVQHKRSLHDATIKAFDRSVREVCANLERISCMCTTVMVRPVALSESVSFAARSIGELSSELLARTDLLRTRCFLKIAAGRYVSSMATLLSRRRKYWQENGNFSIVGSVPVTVEEVLCSFLGTMIRRTDAPPAPVRFDQVSVTFQMPVACIDLAVTRAGHVLLAARQHGLLVYSSRGQQLSSWRPERRSSGRDDEVMCVAVLIDGRAAVGVLHAQLVVLLSLSETGNRWLEDRRVAVLQSPPRRLAVHSDLLAAAVSRSAKQQQMLGWTLGREVQLLSLSSGHLLYSHSREYDIGSVALTALCLLTVSSCRVKRNSRPFVLDAYSHVGEFLWRHETNDEEGIVGLCVSEGTWSRVYAAVVREDGRSCRVMAISESDGKDMREVMSSRTHGLQLPTYLSLARGQQRTVLAVLSMERESKLLRTVSLYEATKGQ